MMRKQLSEFAAENERLQGALVGTATWENYVAQTAPATTIKGKLTKYLAFLRSLRIMRGVGRYGAVRGNLLAGGIAYLALFTIAGALTIAFTVVSVIVGQNKELLDSVVAATNDALPGILKSADNPSGLLSVDSLIVENPFNIVTLISLLVLLWSALALMTSLRSAILAMFGMATIPIPFISAKLRDLLAFFLIGVATLVTVGLTTVAQIFATPIFEFLNLSSSWALTTMNIVSFLIGAFIDTCVFVMIFTLLVGVRIYGKDLWLGAAIGGVISSVLRLAGTSAVSSVADNPLLAPFAAIITLLLWTNLLARVTLHAAAFAANPPEQLAITADYFPHHYTKPNFVTKSKLETLTWAHDPISGVALPDMRAGYLAKINKRVGKIAMQHERVVARSEQRVEASSAESIGIEKAAVEREIAAESKE
ncbi:MAG: YihY/virulence factor BrkB family protein [Arcanobacterium sp.]|nr:YihY/virulence factor BrkB family protein [Arcanobacterium sp.]